MNRWGIETVFNLREPLGRHDLLHEGPVEKFRAAIHERLHGLDRREHRIVIDASRFHLRYLFLRNAVAHDAVLDTVNNRGGRGLFGKQLGAQAFSGSDDRAMLQDHV